MSENEYQSRLQSLKPFITLFLVVMGSAFLASCGGGDSTTSAPTTTSQSADEPNATIQAVSGSTAVPGTWTGRAPKMEVINGITVPPEPAPTINNATLAGVDVNNNGVRDDVERKIALVVKNTADFDKATALARVYQNILKSTGETRVEAANTEKMRQCAMKLPGQIPTELLSVKSTNNIATLLGNNNDRRAKLQNHYKTMGWLVDVEEVRCD